MASNVLRAYPVRSLVVVLVVLCCAVASVRAVVAAKSSSSADKFKVPATSDIEPEGVEPEDRGTGFQGFCYEELKFGGPKIEGVRIVFVSEDGKRSRSAVSQPGGWYRISLAPGRYRVTAEREGFEIYSTERGFFVAGGSEYRTGNFFLKRSEPALAGVGIVKGAALKERVGESETGFGGGCYERLENGAIGPRIEGVHIVFVSEDGTFSQSVVSQPGGWYRISLSPGRYRVTAQREGFETYSTERGFFVAGGSEYRTGNFFLKRLEPAVASVGVVKVDMVKERVGQSDTGFGGGCYERLENGAIGPRIEGVQIVFLSEDGTHSQSVVSQPGGWYRISLAPGRYRVTADREGFEPYSTERGFFVAGGSEYRTGNVFLKRSGTCQ